MPQVQLSGVRGVVFDLDDTLFPEKEYCRSGYRAVADWLKDRITCPIDAAARMGELLETGDRRRIFNQLLQELGCEQPDRLIPEMIACYRSHRPRVTLHPDAEDALHRWVGQFRLGLISDGPLIMQERKVEALGLAARLNPVILTGRYGPEFWKPHPRAFREIQEIWGLSGPACLYLADNPAKDFVAPRQLGWQSVWVRRVGGVYAHAAVAPGGEPLAEISELTQLELNT